MEKYNQECIRKFVHYSENSNSLQHFFLNKPEHRLLAYYWLQKLRSYECENFEDQFVRNRYIRNLMACINKETLFGSFLLKPPKGKLPPTDFYINYYAEEKDTKKGLPQKGSLKKPSFVPNLDQSSQGEYDTLKEPDIRCLTNVCDDSAEEIKLEIQESDPVWKLNVKVLLKAITAELRGDIDNELKQHLDRELERYKDFIMNYPDLMALYEEQSVSSQYSFLLVQLQNDIIKLLHSAE
ncbi:uncharacterized protein LOC119688037 [Teleopsis dalmanni]|uniref:uncharacterized protein LOC119688037 n=1 Tax=Teleopsis dalmanni TaxID=139649 RepID=UPI0018CDE16E|nr:uncharacterized protein LOC119688037 [Teleopsis dalmanni]